MEVILKLICMFWLKKRESLEIKRIKIYKNIKKGKSIVEISRIVEVYFIIIK